ncbi:ABC-type branched-chain amino acid transport system, substrate-binding protein [Bradyrhizobium brasilense]|uniref:ABC-type branched-chain amino acid transport system, substrate-binding protein n=2 Tax=Bradyrhizobium brasilense TaxID=1419277 RepID=A0A1G6VFJ6_9BRAD|nr:ABC-type branched-chain amino acid transport system, substrate-binding protein [Bradyrhizobium brasilense]
MQSTPYVMARTSSNRYGGLPCPPSLLFRNLTSARSDRVFSPMDRDGFGPRGARSRLRIAGFVCCTGSPGMWGPAATSSAQLAVADINRRGGILGREVEFSVYDAGGPIEDVLDRAEQAIASDDVDLIMGMHTSAVRVALRGLITRSKIPYIYTPVYEGGERTPGVIAIGETPRWQNRPSIHWLAEAKRASRWYLIGSDYVWPWQSHRAVKHYIKETGGLVVGEEFVPVGEDNHEAQLERIRAAKPDVVLISLIGTDSVTFNRAFADAGLAATTLRFAGCFDETALLGIGADKTENLYCASGYFPSVGSREGDDFRDRYRAMFGAFAPPVGSCSESAYEGFCLLEAAAKRAGTLDMRPLLAAADNLVYRGPRGPVTVRSGHARMPMYLAEADGLDFRVIKPI